MARKVNLMFEKGGYFFWQDDEGYWNVTKDRDSPPAHCAYKTAEAIAELKGVRL